MPLQNRVDPYGRLFETPARGAWMGNRGLLHDAQQRIRRPFRLKAWLICVLRFKDRHRAVMSPGLYTELFFLDEATALAAGHRPCAECRRMDYNRFKAAAESGAGRPLPRAADMDEALHGDRWSGEGEKPRFAAEASILPDGVFVERDDAAWLLAAGRLHRWTPSGYAEAVPVAPGPAVVLTPRLTVQALRAGYSPHLAL